MLYFASIITNQFPVVNMFTIAIKLCISMFFFSYMIYLTYTVTLIKIFRKNRNHLKKKIKCWYTQVKKWYQPIGALLQSFLNYNQYWNKFSCFRDVFHYRESLWKHYWDQLFLNWMRMYMYFIISFTLQLLLIYNHCWNAASI